MPKGICLFYNKITVLLVMLQVVFFYYQEEGGTRSGYLMETSEIFIDLNCDRFVLKNLIFVTSFEGQLKLQSYLGAYIFSFCGFLYTNIKH